MNDHMPRTPFSTQLSGSAKETEIRIRNIFSGPKKRPPIPLMVLVAAVCIFCGNLVSCQVKEAEGPDTGVSSSLADLPDPPERGPEAEVRERQAVLGDIDLDGDGLSDAVTVTTRYDPQAEVGTYDTLTVTAVLGSGGGLEYREAGEPVWNLINVIEADHITSPDRDALVLELEALGSDLGAAKVYILELVGGELTECYQCDRSGEEPFVTGTYLESREDSPLSAVRIPVLVDKWHAPEYYTLSWNGTGWDLVGDGYFTDAQTVTVTGGRVLTLALRGRVTGEQFGPHLIYDQIQVFDGDMMFNPNKLLQTITEDSVIREDSYLFEGILSGDTNPLIIQDVNFDGSEDFGIYCGASYNGPMYWFLWDEEAGSFRPGFFSSTELTVDTEKKQLVDTWKDGYIGYDRYTYRFNARGERELVEHQRVGSPMPG